MSRNTIKKTENLMLRRIDPVLMYRRYISGEFRNVKIPKSKITISTAFVNLNNKIGVDQNSESYRFNDKTNSSQVIVTTNHEQYSYSKENQSNVNKPELSNLITSDVDVINVPDLHEKSELLIAILVISVVE